MIFIVNTIQMDHPITIDSSEALVAYLTEVVIF